MVGWGQAGYLSEINAAGQVLFNAHLPPDWESYRAYVLALERAAGAAAGGRGRALAGRSRRGDRVRQLERGDRSRLLARARGINAETLTPVSSAAKTGFETAIPLPAGAAGPYVAVQALDGSGAVIGVSPTVKVSGSS